MKASDLVKESEAFVYTEPSVKHNAMSVPTAVAGGTDIKYTLKSLTPIKEQPMMKRMFASLLCLALPVLSSVMHGRNLEGAQNFLAADFFIEQEETQVALQLPAGKGSWLIEASRSGGMRPAKDSVSINSAGEITVISEHYRKGQRQVDCSRKETLSRSDLLKLNRAILSAKPSAWKERYSDPQHPICCDQPTIELSLRWREARGMMRTYKTSWYPGSSQLRPVDLVDVQTLIQPLWNNTSGRCDK